MRKRKKLKSGFTTGACAAAAAKAATLRLFTRKELKQVEICLPDKKRVVFCIHDSGDHGEKAWASVIKEAGDDPDVTNKAEIRAEISRQVSGNRSQDTEDTEDADNYNIIIKGGRGVGIVTKPGLPVAIGKPAINPVPMTMIRESVLEAMCECKIKNAKLKMQILNFEVTISVPDGERLAKKTLNSRLGIIGGISILGTTGIVRPVSSEAWQATITMSMDVAVAVGLKEVVLSTGRRSEKAAMDYLGLPEEAYVMMGDYLRFSIEEAERHDFEKIHIAAQWAKMVKIAMGIPQTHVRHGVLEVKNLVNLLMEMGLEDASMIDDANTAREVFLRLRDRGRDDLIDGICGRARIAIGQGLSGIDVTCYLVGYSRREVIAVSG